MLGRQRGATLSQVHLDSICLGGRCLRSIHIALFPSCLRAGQQLCYASSHTIYGGLQMEATSGCSVMLLAATRLADIRAFSSPDHQVKRQGWLLSPDVPGCV